MPVQTALAPRSAAPSSTRLRAVLALFLTALLAVGAASASPAAAADAAPAPVAAPAPAPSAFTVTPTDKTLQVAWDLPEGVAQSAIRRFELRSRNAAFTAWRSLALPAGQRGRTFTGLTNFVRYEIGVRAITTSGAGAWSPSVIASPVSPALPASAMPAPGDVTARPADRRAIVRWVLPVGVDHAAVTRYELRSKPASASAWGTPKTIIARNRENVVTGLTNDRPYVFSVRAVTAVGPTPWSPDAAATPTGPPPPLAVSLTDEPSVVRARWTPSAGATHYELAYRVSGEAKDVRHMIDADVPATATERKLTLTKGSKYTVYLRSARGTATSPWREAAFVLPDFSLPVVKIATKGEAPVVSKDDYVGGAVAIAPAPGGPTTEAYAGDLEVKGRGNSTWSQPKKPYRLKLGKAAGLLGMPKSKHWVLLANYLDRSAVRNAVTFELGRRSVLPWTPRSRFVEVVLNGRYLGLYQLMEQVRVDAGRIDIDPLKAADTTGDALTGGYHVERDERWVPGGEDAGFRSGPLNQPFALKDPEAPAPEQLSYIKGYFDQTETALLSPGFADPTEGYAKYLDVDSFVDWYVINEYVRATDGWWSSANFYKPRLGKLFMGPLWDFDLSMGLRSGQFQQPATGTWVKDRSAWFTRLFDDPAFVAKVEARWAALRLPTPAFDALVDGQVAQIRTAAGFDKKVWGYQNDLSTEVAKVKTFMKARTAYFDARWAD